MNFKENLEMIEYVELGSCARFFLLETKKLKNILSDNSPSGVANGNSA